MQPTLGSFLRVLALLALLQGAQAQSPGSPAPPAATADRILPLEVVVNGSKGGTWVFVERRGVLYAPRDAFEEWRVQLDPAAATLDFRGESYWPLSAVPGFKAKVDFASQSVELLFSPEAFSALKLSRELEKRPVVSPVLPAVFLNYDANYSASRLDQAGSIYDAGVLAEIGFSNRYGVLTSSHVLRRQSGNLGELRGPDFLRLETAFTRDFPEWNRTLRIGDGSTRSGLWGRNVYFGGIQYGTNFALTPGFVSQPLPALRALSAAPSTVELYVNDVLRQVSNVPAGPFTIDNFPLVTGSGEARLVVRDLLGRETVLTQSFFGSTLLLAQGLDDFSLEAGKVRRDLGFASDSYGDEFASATWRRGLTERQTVEARAEITRRLKVLGGGIMSALPFQFLGTMALAGSDHDRLGRGGLWLVGLEKEWLRASLTMQVQGASSRFRQLGQALDFLPYKLQAGGSLTFHVDSLGSFGLGFAHIERFLEPRVSTISANYTVTLPHRSYLSVIASHALYGTSGTSVGLTYVMPLDDSKTLTTSLNARKGATDFYAAAAKTPGLGSGSLGWRALAGLQNRNERVEGGLYYQADQGNLTAEVSHSPDRSAARVGASGGLIYAAGTAFATRRIDQAFAVAEVKGHPGVGVGVGSNVTARTNADGLALVPNLFPYHNNFVRLDPRDLPVSAEIDSVEATVVPAWRSAVKVDFPIRSGRGALVRVVLEDTQAAPAGATVEVAGDKTQFYVARRGEAFVTGMQDRSRLTLHWKGLSCSFDVELPPLSPDEIPRVGPYVCKGVNR